MKKLINLVLMLILTLVAPTKTQAASVPWVWSTKYRSDLQTFLTNWKGASNPSGCWRSLSQMDPPGCLSLTKVGDILVQLDQDCYFKKKDPTERRQYLMNTPHQVYVMKKVVMAFEQVLNPNTIVYWADQTAAQNMTEGALWIKFAYQGLKDGFIPGEKEDIEFDGSEQAIWALAFIPVDYVDTFTIGNKTYSGNFPVYNLRPKKDLNQSALDQIFNTTRMQPYAFLKNQIDNTDSGWSPDEENALWGVMRAQTEVLNFARINKISPTLAKIKLDAQRLAMAAAMGSVGGLNFTKGAAPAMERTLTLGMVVADAKTIVLKGPEIESIFQGSRVVSKTSQIDKHLSQLQEGINAFRTRYGGYAAGGHSQYFYALDDGIIDQVIRERFHIMSGMDSQVVWSYTNRSGSIIISDRMVKGGRLTEETFRELLRYLRYHGLSGNGLDAVKVVSKYPAMEDVLNDWFTVVGFDRVDGTKIGFQSRANQLLGNDLLQAFKNKAKDSGWDMISLSNFINYLPYGAGLDLELIGKMLGKSDPVTWTRQLNQAMADYKYYSELAKSSGSFAEFGETMMKAGDAKLKVKTLLGVK